MLLPVVERELRIRSRLPSTRYVRMGAAAGLLAFGAVFGLSFTGPGGATVAPGSILYQFFSYLLLLFCLLEGVRLAAGLISDERRDGTLGLLFLTRLGPLDVLLGKLAGATLTAVFALLAMVPVLALAVLLGGVTGGELVRGSIALLNALGLALAAGAWASVRARENVLALLLGLGLVAVLCLVPVLAELTGWLWSGRPGATWIPGVGSSLSPIAALALARDAFYRAAESTFWLGQILQPLLSLALLADAARQLQRTWRDEPSRPAPRKGPQALTRQGSDTALLTHRLRIRTWVWVAGGLTLLASVPNLFLFSGLTGPSSFTLLLAVPAALAGLTAAILVIYTAARGFGESRETGELEILLTTPVGDRALIGHLWRELRLFPIALTLVAAVNAGGEFAVLSLRPGSPWQGNPAMLAAWVAREAGGIVSTWFSISALIWVALWFSLTTRRLAGAVARTFVAVFIGTGLLVTLLQLLLSFLFAGTNTPLFSYLSLATYPLLVVLVSHLWIRWAKGRLNTSLRIAAAGLLGASTRPPGLKA